MPDTPTKIQDGGSVKDERIKVGSVVQISPDTLNQMFAGCYLTVTEVKDFGVQGYVQALGTNGEPGGLAYLRPTWANIEYVGEAVWAAGIQEDSPHA